MLALAGSGEYLPSMDEVDLELMQRLGEQAHVACIPAAAGTEGEVRLKYWMELGEAHFTRLGATVQALPVMRRADALDERWIEAVGRSNFVYFSGGKPDYLYNVLENTPLWQAVLEVHQRGGVVAGCSAGAMILGEHLPGFFSMGRGFGLLPGVLIAPHFDEFPAWLRTLLRITFAWRALVVGIDGNTALLAGSNGWEVLGSGSVTIWEKGRAQKLSHGNKIIPPGRLNQPR